MTDTIHWPIEESPSAAASLSSQSPPQKVLQLPKNIKSVDDLMLRSPLFQSKRRKDELDDDDDDDDGRKQPRSVSLPGNACVGRNNHHYNRKFLPQSRRVKGSFNEIDSFVLNRILLADFPNTELNEDMLLSIPDGLDDDTHLPSFFKPQSKMAKVSVSTRRTAHCKNALVDDLWRAHEAGIGPKALAKRRRETATALTSPRNHIIKNDNNRQGPSLYRSRTFSASPKERKIEKRKLIAKKDTIDKHIRRGVSLLDGSEDGVHADDYDDDFLPSDEEVRPHYDDFSSEDDDWDDHHFDTWRLLTNEYPTDFGFDQHKPSRFLILGTSADDKSASPHVMSPPMMDALTKRLPTNIRGDNFWLKFSLVRDGANLETLKRYVRSSHNTILVIENSRGEVFGSFTTSPWRNQPSFFGSAPAFVWNMRGSRATKTASLFEQAFVESQVDVYPYVGKQQSYVQVCQSDLLAVGGDETTFQKVSNGVQSKRNNNLGFAIALGDDLFRGTTSPCSTFNSLALCGGNRYKSSVFSIVGLEVWTFTSCRDVECAEKVEFSRLLTEETSSRDFFTNHSTLHPNQTSTVSQAKLFQRAGLSNTTHW